jgi:uncharacterized protein
MGHIRVLPTSVGWLPWGTGAFARARAERKPVLLSLTASWCQWCREMDRTSYADPAIAALLNERFVPVRVDADERPDISERYSLGGWPTTAFLNADGAILGGGTFVPIERMPDVLTGVLSAFDAQAGVAAARPSPPQEPTARASHASLAGITASVFSTFDAPHGGFGDEPKFPHVAPLHLALDLWSETRDPQYEHMLVTSLDAMGWGGLYDDVDGGFFRYAARRDWQAPHTEKLLETNAALIRLYLDAGSVLGVTRFTERAADALRYVQTWLAEPVDGGWFGSQQADEGYYAADTPDRRRTIPAPPVARLQFADSNGAMVSTALHAAGVFEDEGLRAFALTSLERVLLGGYKPGAGAAHFSDGQPRVRGLLVDQAAMAAANLDAHEATGNVVYEMMAEELASYAIRLMWDEGQGGFFDCADEGEAGVGLMRQRLKPFAANCDFARTLRRLALASGDPSFAERAESIAYAMAPIALEQGPLAAHYVRAVRDLPKPVIDSGHKRHGSHGS